MTFPDIKDKVKDVWNKYNHCIISAVVGFVLGAIVFQYGLVQFSKGCPPSRQETKMMMADAQHNHASKMAKGDIDYQGKLLEARQSDWKDEFVLVVLTLPILVIAYGVFSEDPEASAKIKEFFVQFQQLPQWFTNLWILVVASIYGIKGTQIFRGGKK